ncbi:hypothetical protein [Kitasatospora sp. NPDC088783]|uniref:hypothetical protein n=1 Tax=Kitasatospora sp. NPDC088783 TaxID=3364077 RepID=UPI0037FE044F
MPTLLRVLPVLVTVAAVAVRQWRGGPLRPRRVLLAPLLLLVLGLFTRAGLGGPAALLALAPADAVLLAVAAAGAAAVGAGQGRTLRLEDRAGVLWARMPAAGLCWWPVLAGLRAATAHAGAAAGAHAAASGATAVLFLGANRLGQAAVLLPRARATGLPSATGLPPGAAARPGRPAGHRPQPLLRGPNPRGEQRYGAPHRDRDRHRDRREERRRERSATRPDRRRGGAR